MSDEFNRDAILDDFAMEQGLGPELLGTYIEQHPSLVVELVDLYHELLLVDLSSEVEGGQLETKSVIQDSMQETTDVASVLSGNQLRDLAKNLALPRDFIAGFRDRKIRPGSIPGVVLVAVARSADIFVHQLVRHLQGPNNLGPQMAYKAVGKPVPSPQVDYHTFIDGLGLNPAETEALNRITLTDGSD